MSSKSIKTTIIENIDYEDTKEPSNYYIVNALDQRVYFHCRGRSDAQKSCDEEYGVGKYKVRTSGVQKTTKTLTARG